jgi:hypothetical protein
LAFKYPRWDSDERAGQLWNQHFTNRITQDRRGENAHAILLCPHQWIVFRKWAQRPHWLGQLYDSVGKILIGHHRQWSLTWLI